MDAVGKMIPLLSMFPRVHFPDHFLNGAPTELLEEHPVLVGSTKNYFQTLFNILYNTFVEAKRNRYC